MADLLGFVALTVLIIVPCVVNWLKGNRLWATVGLASGYHMVPAFRLAKPDSWWARRFYDDAKLREATARYPRAADLADHAPAVATVADFSADDIVFEDKITRKAWQKAQRGR